MSNDKRRWGKPEEPASAPVPPQLALISLATGILGMITSSFCFVGVVPSMIAIGTGVMGRAEIARSEGALPGARLAMSGIVLGVLGLVFFVAGVILLAVKDK